MRPRALAGSLRLTGLVAAACLVGCQLVAGLGSIQPNDASSSGPAGGNGGGTTASSGGGELSGGGRGGNGAAGAGGASCGGGGGTASKCEWVSAFDEGPLVAPSTRQTLAVATNGFGYVGGLSTSTSCPAGCPFIQEFGEAGANLDAAVLAATNAVTLDGLGVTDGPKSDVAFAGTLGNAATLTLPGPSPNTLHGNGGSIYVAQIGSDLVSRRWFTQLSSTVFPATSVRLGVDVGGNVRVAGSAVGSAVWSAGGMMPMCQVSSTDADVFLATLSKTNGSCIAMTTFGGPGAQSVAMLRVAHDDGELVAGTFDKTMTFPGGAHASTAGLAAYYTFVDSTGSEEWHEVLDGPTAQILGGGISPGRTFIAVTGGFTGAPPVGLYANPAAFRQGCDNPAAMTMGFLKTHGNVETHAPSTGIELCLGDGGVTTIDDAVIDDSGNVVLGGSTTGIVNFGSFELNASGGQAATFLLSLAHDGTLLWARSSKSSSAPQELVHLTPIREGGMIFSGVFGDLLDLGCGCGATATASSEVFVGRFGE